MEHQLSDTLLQCPSCSGNNFVTHLELDDYFLSQEHFTISKCTKCGLLITVPQPSETDLGKYYKSSEYISHATKNTGIEFWLYDQVRKITLSSKLKLIKKYSIGKRLLDIGCATGVFLDYCGKRGFIVQGIEPNQNARHYANKQFGLTVNDVSHLTELPYKSFDVITMWHVLEHVSDLNERLVHLNNLLADEGTAFIALPNPLSYDALHYKNHWAAYDVPRHLYHFTQQSFSTLIAKHNLKIIEIVPMVFDAYYISLQSEKYRNGSKSFLKALYQGFRSNQYAKANGKNYSSLIYILKKTK